MGKRPSGSRPPSRSSLRPANIGLQKAALLRQYPNGTVPTTHPELVWAGSLTPTEFSRTYDVVIAHRIGGPRPLVYVAEPRLKLVNGLRLPHVFSLNTLCLSYGNREWNNSMLIANTLVPWTAEWLAYYEVWLATDGDWMGGGIHFGNSEKASPEKAEEEARRRNDFVRRKTDRLKTALRIAYGPRCDLEQLLYNARLAPQS